MMGQAAFAVTSENGALSIESSTPIAVCATCQRPPTPDPFADVRVTVEDPARLSDFMHVPPLYVASALFLDVVQEHRMVGLASNDLPGAKGVFRIHPAVVVSFVQGGPVCEGCGREQAPMDGGWDLAATTWSGQHFFAFNPHPTVLFCSESAREALEATSLTGMIFVEAGVIPLD